jgi:hypothetical protein
VAIPGGVDKSRAVPNLASGGGIVVIGTGTISHSTFDHNQAIGGQGTAASNGGVAKGGGIDAAFAMTDVTVNNCTVEHNLAIGGQAGAGGSGGDAWGGGVSAGEVGAKLTVTGSIIDHNQAQGGSADTSGPASNGGRGLGGGVYNISGSTMNVIASSIAHNLALGASGSNGGDGLGGGFYNGGTANLAGSVIEFNLALGGEASSGSPAGQGIGGGVYTLGAFGTDAATVIKKNHASTIDETIHM